MIILGSPGMLEDTITMLLENDNTHMREVVEDN